MARRRRALRNRDRPRLEGRDRGRAHRRSDGHAGSGADAEALTGEERRRDMTDHIAGNPASFPASVALWEDSDPPDAAHFNLGPEDLADRTSNLDARVTAEVADRTAAIAAAIHLLTQIIDVQS